MSLLLFCTCGWSAGDTLKVGLLLVTFPRSDSSFSSTKSRGIPVWIVLLRFLYLILILVGSTTPWFYINICNTHRIFFCRCFMLCEYQLVWFVQMHGDANGGQNKNQIVSQPERKTVFEVKIKLPEWTEYRFKYSGDFKLKKKLWVQNFCCFYDTVWCPLNFDIRGVKICLSLVSGKKWIYRWECLKLHGLLFKWKHF